MIEDKKLKKNILKLWSDLGCRFSEMPASTKFHHNSRGGLYQHTKEVIQIAFHLYKLFDAFQSKGIKLDDVILIAFVHDLDKIYKYVPNNKDKKGYEFGWNYNRIDRNDTADIVNTLGRYGIHLTAKQLNALSFSHGGWSVDRKGKMKSLATLIHCADIMSLAFEGGKKDDSM